MKWVLFISLTALSLSLSNAQSLSVAENALKGGKASELSKFFTPKVKICFDDEVKFVSQSAAESMLKNFFAQNQPNAYQRKHIGGEGKSRYSVGELSTSRGKYRVHLYYSDSDTSFLIDEIRFTPQR